jgi:hypothetical protein
MNWLGRFELLDPIPGTAHSFHGRDPGSSKSVIVHLLEAGDETASRALLLQVMALPPEAFAHVREIGEHEGAAYVVTDAHFGESGLPAWLHRARASDGRYAPVHATVSVKGAGQASIGEFTRMFQAAKATPAAPRPEAAAPPPGPGEFTRLFVAPKAPPQAAPAAVPAPPEIQSGEFTRLFSSPRSAEPVKAAAAAGMGDITRLFQRRAAPSMDVSAEAHEQNTPAAVQEINTPAPAPGDVTRLLEVRAATRDVEPPAGATQSPQPAPIPSAAAVGGSPGDYTRVIAGRPPNPPPSAAPESAKPQAPAPARPTRLAPILVFSILVLLALGLVLFFALRH